MALNDQPSELEVELKIGPTTPELLRGLGQFGRNVRPQNGEVHLQMDNEDAVPALARWVIGQGAPLYRLATTHKSLEALFLEVMGEDERPG